MLFLTTPHDHPRIPQRLQCEKQNSLIKVAPLPTKMWRNIQSGSKRNREEMMLGHGRSQKSWWQVLKKKHEQRLPKAEIYKSQKKTCKYSENINENFDKYHLLKMHREH
ncbi:hypothetical protein KQX54_004567 [Cotesia glomerata]|uniref:Uncharacterized protein n=1 Tax=Cotesia glomerata TaxID=32391 RepID=A0AAV7IFR3_COTGL|nr:hypothetical protein KQX54_004567 [Cotesia glomerata]